MYSAASFREACEHQNASHKGTFHIIALIKAILLDFFFFSSGLHKKLPKNNFVL